MTDGLGGQGPLATRSALRTPRAAAVAGIVFSALLIYIARPAQGFSPG